MTKNKNALTPLGVRLREMRKTRNVTLQQMAAALGVSSPYLSALEHGQRGRPSYSFVQKVITYFNVIWDEAETLQQLAMISHPKISIDTSDLSPTATEFANLLATDINRLSETDLAFFLQELQTRTGSVAEDKET